MADAEGEIQLVEGDGADNNPITDEQEEMHKQRVTWIKAVLGELLCTTLFLFIVMAAGVSFARSQELRRVEATNPVVAAISTGFCAVALIYSFADVSGAHFNPAVTFATLVTRKTTPFKAVFYWFAQLGGSVIATFLLWLLYPKLQSGDGPVEMSIVGRPSTSVTIGQAFLMEAILTFILIYVIFAVAFDTIPPAKVVTSADGQKTGEGRKLTIYTTSGATKAGFAPIAIGFTLGFLTFLGGTVSGGAFNPARAFGPAVWTWVWKDHWLYWIADFVGAGIAGYTQLFFGARTKFLCW
eukprot:TRINITY_DN6830_c0_g1_i1.p1 TRINITY_DN6830_c0_g1~~TRINITY_DN6830_c0_g1_i1.p1  ORF type:complete len:297 (+),score=71.63 TRINITY_DN6830_c0_g1_i1:48-938(+)